MKRTITGLALVAMLYACLVTSAHAEKSCADVNKDGTVGSVDAAIILQVDAGLYDPGLILLNMWDPYDDNMIDSRDALLVLQFDAGIIDELDDCYGPAPTPTPLPI
jgi:hypothetical protein